MTDTADDTPPVEKKPLLFYCRDCERTFQAQPDATGYEQAPCPDCHEICMTVQFEQDQQQRHGNEATLFSFIPVPPGAVTLVVAAVDAERARRVVEA